MRWQVALAIPIVLTGFLILLESIENVLNHCEGNSSVASSQQTRFPSMTSERPSPAQPPVTTRVEWPLPWATLDVDYREYLDVVDESPRLVDRSHVAQLPYEERTSRGGAPAGEAEGAAAGNMDNATEESPYFHLRGVRVRDMEECY